MAGTVGDMVAVLGTVVAAEATEVTDASWPHNCLACSRASVHEILRRYRIVLTGA